MKIHPVYIYKQKKNDGIHHHSQSSKISSGDAHNSLTNFLNSTDLSLIVDEAVFKVAFDIVHPP